MPKRPKEHTTAVQCCQWLRHDSPTSTVRGHHRSTHPVPRMMINPAHWGHSCVAVVRSSKLNIMGVRVEHVRS